MSVQTKKIIILGHGFIKNIAPTPTQSLASAKVYFYCPAYKLLDRHFIPTFVRYILNQVTRDEVKDVITQSLIEAKSDYIEQQTGDWTFLFEDYNKEHVVSSKGDYMFQMLYSNKLPQGTINRHEESSMGKKRFQETFREVFLQEIKNITIGSGTFTLYELQGNTIVIVPLASCKENILLSEIIDWATCRYCSTNLEFHWLACREPFINNDDESICK